MIRLLVLFFIYLVSVSFTLADVVPLTILAVNDFHAHLLPDEQDAGGAARIAAYF